MPPAKLKTVTTSTLHRQSCQACFLTINDKASYSAAWSGQCSYPLLAVQVEERWFDVSPSPIWAKWVHEPQRKVKAARNGLTRDPMDWYSHGILRLA